MYKKISDYGIIGNLHSIALVGFDGSIDWLCLPHIDSPSVFAALLDDRKGGRFSISPLDDWDPVAGYIPDTNILTTKFRTRTGVMSITDFMPIRLVLSSTHDLHLEDGTADAAWSLSEGEDAWFHLSYGSNEPLELDRHKARTSLRETEAFWQSWLRKRAVKMACQEGRGPSCSAPSG